MAIVDSPRLIVGGVDTHRDTNVAAVVDMNGGLLGVESFPTTADGHRSLASWMAGFGVIERVGIEGTGAYGAGLARHFARAAVTVIEVDRPNRQKRRQRGKSDRIDAIEAARGALSGRCEGIAKTGDGAAEALRALLVAKRSARSTRIRTIVQLRYLMFTAPDELRAKLGGLSAALLVSEAAKLRPRPCGDIVMHSVKTTAVILARRVQALDVELATIDAHIGRQSPPPGGPFEARTRDQLASVELPLPAAPGPEVIGQRILIRLEPGAFTTGEQPTIDPTKISLTWIQPVED